MLVKHAKQLARDWVVEQAGRRSPLPDTCLVLDQLRSPEQVLSDYRLAGGFRRPSVIFDPSGHLAALQATVSRDFARRDWIRRRWQHPRSRILEQLAALNASEPSHDRVTAWVSTVPARSRTTAVAS